MNYKQEIIKLIEDIDKENEKTFLSQIYIMIKTHICNMKTKRRIKNNFS